MFHTFEELGASMYKGLDQYDRQHCLCLTAISKFGKVKKKKVSKGSIPSVQEVVTHLI